MSFPTECTPFFALFTDVIVPGHDRFPIFPFTASHFDVRGHTYNLPLLRAGYDFLGFWAWFSLVTGGLSMTGTIAGASASRSSNLFQPPKSSAGAANPISNFGCVGISAGNVNTGAGPPNNFQQPHIEERHTEEFSNWEFRNGHHRFEEPAVIHR